MNKLKPISFVGLWFSAILAGGIIGGVTNAMNAHVSAEYFRITMNDWQNVQNITAMIITQGIIQGLMMGVLLATIFAAIIGIVSRMACPWVTSVKYLLLLALFALVCWCIGGGVGYGLAWFNPEYFTTGNENMPGDPAKIARYAFVNGSIIAVQFGGAASVLIVSLLFRASWKNRVNGEAGKD